MKVKLLLEKVYWALAKRTRVKKQKSYEGWLAKGYNNTPDISFIIQSHNKSNSVIHTVKQLRKYPKAEIIVMDDGSTPDHTKRLVNFLDGANEFLIRANDLYENVMYDKAIRFANGTYLVLLQDDDEIVGLDWVDKAIAYFRQYPDMAILGGFNGLDFTIYEEEKWGVADLYKNKDISEKEFLFVHAVNRAPMFIHKPLYMQHLKHIRFSFAPFQCDDTELCLRAWLSGLKVGWYNAGFRSLMAGGMRIWNNEFTRTQEQRNKRQLYDLYKDHIIQLNGLVEEANKSLS
ncbi:glycosyltransferase [Parabacteroides sp. PF5-6]|uniref:glycosyltransferase family 2 protein n=1 Tax=Parabacteroides sp. PF5-6 TaxID=1742403 RepID=UPI0024057601|nr:glycosyltransferase [Parabacteroides sp. PF5-6]MDF9830954.1 glycosyltransferase involved in cell wall biosynthesis [Parabacteroides sp. PF5-6]